MHNLSQLHVYSLSRDILRGIHQLRIPEFGDLQSQIQRAAISIVSNIAEGAGTNTNKQFVRFLSYAKASSNEIQAQLNILQDITGQQNTGLNHKLDRLGAMLYKLMQRLK